MGAIITYKGGTGNDVVLRLAYLSPHYFVATTATSIVITDAGGNSEGLSLSQNGTNIRFAVSSRFRA